jgi:PAS domain S-box-containing protein
MLGTTARIDSVAVYLVEGEVLMLQVAVGMEGLRLRRWRLGEGLPGRVAARRVGEQLAHPLPEQADVPAGTRVVLAHPVLLDSTITVGVVQMGSCTAADLSAEDRHLLEALARRVATEVGALRVRELEAHHARERLLEEDLAESEERFRTVFEDAAIGIAVADVQGRFLRTNRALQELAGYSEAELRQRSIADLTPPGDMARERRLFRELQEGRRQPYRIERRFIRKDGTVGWCRLTVSLGRGLPVFRTRMDLAEAARAAADELASVHPGRSLRCELEGAVWGHWDADRIAQVLSNLLSNALQYSPQDSEVRLVVREDGDWVELAVHNRGPPIPSERLLDLFEPFRRGTRWGERTREGNLGLGLFIVSQIVRAHGGDISVRSSTDESTTFTVRLPRVCPVREATESPGEA